MKRGVLRTGSWLLNAIFDMQTLTVNLGDRSYPIHLGEDLLPRAGKLLKQAGCGEKIAIITNPTVARLYLKPVEEGLVRSGFRVTPVLVPEGEEHKNLKSLSAIVDRLISERFERSSSLIALGGGVIGDLAGFAAATFLRGVPYVQIPTTLLAQVDSSVGGKTGVNHREGKNLIGAFYQPRLVLIDVGVLQTLPRRELLAGLAEVIKYGLLKILGSLFCWRRSWNASWLWIEIFWWRSLPPHVRSRPR